MPGAEIVAIEAAPWRAGIGAEVFEVRRRLSRFVIVISRRRTGALAMASPAQAVTLDKFLRRASGVSVIAGGENRAGNLVQQFRRRFRPVAVATGDIAGAD